MRISQNGITFIQNAEGCKLVAYKDQGGVWTCGYGCTGSDIDATTQWTRQQAIERFNAVITRFATGVDLLLKVPVTQNQFDSLCSFSFNLGLHALGASTLLQKLNNGDTAGACSEFPKWCHIGHVEDQGLLNRRNAEATLFAAP